VTQYTSIRTALKAVLDAVPNIGATHDRERYVVDPAAYLDMFKVTISGTVQIRAWLILRERAEVIDDAVFGEVRRRHWFVLRGYLGFQDSTDTYGTLQSLCDSVMAAFDNQTTLGVTGVVVRTVGPATLRSFETGQFGSVLAHIVEIEVPVDTLLPLGTA
jgi:hypothetical protein